MYLLYSTILSIGFLLMMPLFILRREKYAAGFKQRLGNYPEFKHDGRKVIWLHCVSVGEANAARPLVDAIKGKFPNHRVVISTTTKTGQELAQKIFAEKADAIFYFPFDWKFSVRKALENYKPAVVLLMETELWPRFIHEAGKAGAKVAIVNGRLSERSSQRYGLIRPFVHRVLTNIDAALMQTAYDAERIICLGLERSKVWQTGNLKFDLELNEGDDAITKTIDSRFQISDGRPLIVAASTHDPEERWVLDAFCSLAAGDLRNRPRLLIAPRHPERFDTVAKLLNDFRNDPSCEWPRYQALRRSELETDLDENADVILLDSIGELRGVYPLADVVFVGGSLIPHGGQSILEPAAAGKAIVTGHHVHNFTEVVRTFLDSEALIQLQENTGAQIADDLFLVLSDLLENEPARNKLGRNAATVMNANRGATAHTIEHLNKLITEN